MMASDGGSRAAARIAAIALIGASVPVASLTGQGSEVHGPWSGVISLPGIELQITVRFFDESGRLAGTIDVPQQGAVDLRLEQVSFDSSKVHFELPAGATVAVFDGVLVDSVISGDFSQGPALGTFQLVRTAPQPQPAGDELELGFREEEVTFQNGAFRFGGTLVLPTGEGPFPAVVMISGSGAQNRDANLFGFEIFRLMAEDLVAHGIASLRYDDRGVGRSTGNVLDATTTEFAGDVLAGVQLLSGHSEIFPHQIGLLGHSEGAMVAAVAATQSDQVSFVVMLAGPAVSGEKTLISQGEAMLRAVGAGEADLEQQRDVQALMFEAIRNDSDWNAVEPRVRELIVRRFSELPDSQRARAGDPQVHLERVRAQLSAAKNRWFRHFLEFDPAPYLKSIDVPVLAIYGELDTQVPLEENRTALVEALGSGAKSNLTVLEIPQANHLFQEARTGSPSEYSTLNKALVPGLSDKIGKWIGERVE